MYYPWCLSCQISTRGCDGSVGNVTPSPPSPRAGSGCLTDRDAGYTSHQWRSHDHRMRYVNYTITNWRRNDQDFIMYRLRLSFSIVDTRNFMCTVLILRCFFPVVFFLEMDFPFPLPIRLRTWTSFQFCLRTSYIMKWRDWNMSAENVNDPNDQ